MNPYEKGHYVLNLCGVIADRKSKNVLHIVLRLKRYPAGGTNFAICCVFMNGI